MKGLEFNKLLGLIVMIVVILLVFIIVIGPTIGTGKNMRTRVEFEDFCVFWSLNGYAERGINETVERDGCPQKICGTPGEFCSSILNKPVEALDSVDIENCVKCCRKEIIC